MRVATTTIPPPAKHICLAWFDHIDNQGFAVFGQHLRPDRDPNRDGFARPTGTLPAHAMHADFGLEVLLIAEIDQGVEVLDRLEDDVATPAAIAAVRPAILDIFFTAEADRTGTAAATAHINLGFIEKLHNRSFGRTRLSFCIGTPAREDRASTRHKIHISHKTREE